MVAGIYRLGEVTALRTGIDIFGRVEGGGAAVKIILISGKAQNGKDTAADILQNHLEADNHTVLITHYADLLKFICHNYFDWNGKKDDAGRQLLQYVGTDVVRKLNPTLWVDFVAMMLRYFHENWDYVIIPDCRFPNEITTMLDSGFETIHIRVIRENFQSPLTEEQQQHPSETALDGVIPDYYIKNDGTLDNLSDTIIKWIKENLYGNDAV